MALDSKFYQHFQPQFEVYYKHHRPLLVEQVIKCSKEQRDDLIAKINHLDAISKEVELACKKNDEEIEEVEE